MVEAMQKALTVLKLQQVVLISLINIKLLRKWKKKFRRWWVKPHLFPEIRNSIGAYAIVCQYFKIHDHEEFESQFKMTVANFEQLHNLVGLRLQKQYRIRAPIPSCIRLACTLHYLGQGGSAKLHSLYYRVGLSTFYNIINETCKVIAMVLLPIYMQFPTQEVWLRIAQDFERMWDFPNCVGALDGKHVRIRKPPHGGSFFYNYKKFHSLVLMAISDAHSRFVWFTLGDGGSFSDSSVFNHSTFCRNLTNNQLQILAPRPLPNSNRTSPFVFVADEIFALGQNLMKPYNRRLLRTNMERIFNYRLSRARYTIECAFGVLCAKWQILYNALAHNFTNSKFIVSACLAMHNFLITTNNVNLNNEQENFGHIEVQNVNNINERNAIFIRQNLAEYFSNEGAVPWQEDYI